MKKLAGFLFAVALLCPVVSSASANIEVGEMFYFLREFHLTVKNIEPVIQKTRCESFTNCIREYPVSYGEECRVRPFGQGIIVGSAESKVLVRYHYITATPKYDYCPSGVLFLLSVGEFNKLREAHLRYMSKNEKEEKKKNDELKLIKRIMGGEKK